MEKNVGEAEQTSAVASRITEYSAEELFEIALYRNMILKWRILGYADGCSIIRDSEYGSWFGKDVQYIIHDIQCRYEEVFCKKMECRQNENDHQLMIDCLDIFCPKESGYCVKCDMYYIDMECNCILEENVDEAKFSV